MKFGYSQEEKPQCVKGAVAYMAYLDEVSKNTDKVLPYFKTFNGIYCTWYRMWQPCIVDDYGNIVIK